MPPNLGDMLVAKLAAAIVVGAMNRLENGARWDFRVDNDLPLAWEMHNYIRPLPAVAEVDRFLNDEIAMLDHSSQLHGSPQLQLSPCASYVRIGQRAREFRRCSAQLIIC